MRVLGGYITDMGGSLEVLTAAGCVVARFADRQIGLRLPT